MTPLRFFALLCACAGSAACCSALVALLQQRSALAADASHRPLEVHDQHYVSSNECRRCHPREYASWSDSYHRRMTQLAKPDTVFGQFDNVTLGDVTPYQLGRSDAGYYVELGAPSERHPISLVTGSHHMQIYWYETGHDRNLGQLPYVFLRSDRRWVPRNAIFLEPPEPMQPAAEGRWNASCIACHTTLGQPRIDKLGKFDTQVAEFGIACEACHGPGETHVAHNQSPLTRYRSHLTGAGDDSIVQPKKLTHQRASYICAQCHATSLFDSPASMRDWNEHGTSFRPGNDRPSSVWLLQPSRAAVEPRVAAALARDPDYVAAQFWSDGAIRVSGREFNGLVDSACYTRGEMSCSSCHAMHESADDPRPAERWREHQLAAGMEGDHACLQCHRDLEQQPEQHTHHSASSEASRCYNCHMPYTTYGLLKALRSHRIGVPSVAESIETGRPNACNLCHLDKSLGWTARQLQALYGTAAPVLERDQAEQPLALWFGLRGNAGQRALIAWALGWKPATQASRPDFAPALLGTLMDDPYTAVRYIAERSARSRGLARDLAYDFVQAPAERAPVADAIARRMAPGLPEAERTRLRREVDRLRSERDDTPMRLLE